LNRQGFPVNRKRVQRLMRLMGIESVVPNYSELIVVFTVHEKAKIREIG